ncbi:MAG: hypothetical protein AAF940_10740 [Pseudomonadota bacterium]
MSARLLADQGWITPLLLAGGVILLAGCQSTNSPESTSAIPVLESAAAPATAPDGTEVAPDAAGVESTDADPAATVPETQAAPTQQARASDAQSESDQLRTAAVQIAGLEKERGRQAAFQSVLACYERAKVREAPVSLAKTCATQDFVISRGRQEAGGQRDQQLIIAERAPQRIGALMELKGMGQAEFNNFGLLLNRVALPAYRQARL